MPDVRIADFYDIIVIGAGPAGASAAKVAASRGANVLMIEQKRRIGIPVQCAEFVAKLISRYASFSTNCVVQTVETMLTHFPDGTIYEIKSPGYMLDRSLFDKELVTSAVLSGAKISIGTRAVQFLRDGLVVRKGSEERKIRAKVFIGAYGARSFITHLPNLKPLKTIVALQYEVVTEQFQSHLDIFFKKEYEGGYAWFFPKGKTANVGVGVIPSKKSSLQNLLDHFLNFLIEYKKLSKVEIISKTGGSIPCEPHQNTVFDNIMLVGDAAGHTHPITGAGILNAVIGGEIAGRIASEAAARDDLSYLQHYEVEWRKIFGESIQYGAFKRKCLEENWNDSKMDFNDLIKKSWIGFKEYYVERKDKSWNRK